ncbi:MAG: hypothetical protein V1858_03675 [Candidatus Gottesmanbacteria bacterium]
MKVFKKFINKLETGSKQEIYRYVFLTFLIGFLIGFCSGLSFREIRLNMLSSKKRIQAITEAKSLKNLFQEIPVATSYPKK